MRRDERLFLTCGSSALLRVEREGRAAAWFAGILAALSVQGQTASTAVMALSESFFEPPVADNQKVSLASLSP